MGIEDRIRQKLKNWAADDAWQDFIYNDAMHYNRMSNIVRHDAPLFFEYYHEQYAAYRTKAERYPECRITKPVVDSNGRVITDFSRRHLTGPGTVRLPQKLENWAKYDALQDLVFCDSANYNRMCAIVDRDAPMFAKFYRQEYAKYRGG